jgi:hypothetical protein
MHLLNHRQAANTRTNDATDPLGQFRRQGLTGRQPGILHSLNGSCQPVMDERIHGAGVFDAEVFFQFKSLDFAGNAASKSRCVKAGNGRNATAAGQQVVPRFGH